MGNGSHMPYVLDDEDETTNIKAELEGYNFNDDSQMSMGMGSQNWGSESVVDAYYDSMEGNDVA